VVRTQRLEDISKLLPGHLQWPPSLSYLFALSLLCSSGTQHLVCFLNQRWPRAREIFNICTFYLRIPVAASKGLSKFWVTVPEKISTAEICNSPVSRQAGGFWGRNPREELKIPPTPSTKLIPFLPQHMLRPQLEHIYYLLFSKAELGLREFKYRGIRAEVYSFQKHVFFPISGHIIYLVRVHQSGWVNLLRVLPNQVWFIMLLPP